MSPELGTAVNTTPQSFNEGSQLDTSPQLTQAEGEKGGMVGPGQEGLVEELEREQQSEAEQEAILGKFKSPQELAKAYQELQRKLGQQGQEQSEPEPEAQPDAAPESEGSYSAEQASERYGKAAVEGLAEKGLDLGKVMWQVDAGQDVSEHYDTLAEQFNVSPQVVADFVANSQGANTRSDGEIPDAVANQLVQQVGGQEAFNELGAWAKANLPEQEVAAYNAVVESGNAEAISWALRSFQARQGQVAADTEPELYGGGAPTDSVVRFESQQQVLDAMNKRNDRGQRLYDVDEAYRNKVSMILNNSDVF